VQRVAALLRWEAQLTGGDLGVPMVKRGWIGVRARVAWEGLESLRPGIEEHLQLQRHSCVARLLPVAYVVMKVSLRPCYPHYLVDCGPG